MEHPREDYMEYPPLDRMGRVYKFRNSKRKTLLLWGLATIGFLITHAMNYTPAELPTIQKMQRVILEHGAGEAVTVVQFYPKEARLHLWIENPLTEGTDGACVAFAQIIWSLMLLDSRLIIEVDGEFVPSRQNPIDFTWAQELMRHAEL